MLLHPSHRAVVSAPSKFSPRVTCRRLSDIPRWPLAKYRPRFSIGVKFDPSSGGVIAIENCRKYAVNFDLPFLPLLAKEFFFNFR